MVLVYSPFNFWVLAPKVSQVNFDWIVGFRPNWGSRGLGLLQQLYQQRIIVSIHTCTISLNIVNVSGEVVTLKTGDINVYQTPILSYLQSSLSCFTLESVIWTLFLFFLFLSIAFCISLSDSRSVVAVILSTRRNSWNFPFIIPFKLLYVLLEDQFDSPAILPFFSSFVICVSRGEKWSPGRRSLSTDRSPRSEEEQTSQPQHWG